MNLKQKSCAIISVLLFFGCKTPRNDSRPLSDGELEGYLQTSPDYMSEGFTIKVERVPSEAIGQPESDPMLVLEDGSGSVVSRTPYISEGFALDQEVLPDGSVIYKWPKASEVIDRDYERLGELMKEYSKVVGTLLKRDAKGPGEVAWRQWIRRDQGREVEAARRDALRSEKIRQRSDPFEIGPVTTAWCNANVTQLVDRLVPTGSKYRQYGNCGEGGQIGACLAKRAGFKEKEIRVCLSANDHFFSMVYRGQKDGVDHKWCILDRWDIIGNFACGVDIDTDARQVTHKGNLVNESWFKRVGCTTLDEFMVDPWTSLYDSVGRF